MRQPVSLQADQIAKHFRSVYLNRWEASGQSDNDVFCLIYREYGFFQNIMVRFCPAK